MPGKGQERKPGTYFNSTMDLVREAPDTDKR